MAEKKKLSLEEAMARLEEVVAELENEQLPLEKSLKLYEEGISLIRASSELLDRAELSVKMLSVESDGSVSLKSFQETEGEG